MKNIGMVVKVSNPDAIKFGCELARWIDEKGGAVFVDPELAPGITPSKAVSREEFLVSIDVLLVLGGDGTIISTARLVADKKIPILGINLGGLGFLTAVTVDEAHRLIEKILNGDFTVEERMMLYVEHKRDGRVIARYRVMNDAVIKGTAVRLVRVETRINSEYVTTYRADGLIVATPTGSTAYSLSAAGPILYPTIHSIIVVPICPFNLTNRPVVIPDWMTVDVSVCPEQTGISLVLDGQVDVSLSCGDVVTMKKADTCVYLVKYEGKSYFDILRERLMWEVKVEKR
ncbi:MAG: NAD(+)/NADH kinase [Thermodesulfobacteriota bacterium]